ncbi:MAG: cation:proton antiporter [Longimicrobiales bacterium]
MTEFQILRDLGYVVVALAVAVLIARKLKIPPIIAYIAAGLVLGPFMRLVGDSPPIEQFSRIGIALLLFLVGLELDRETLRGAGRAAVAAGIAQVTLVAAAAFGIAQGFGFLPGPALLVALAVTFSSTIVVVKLLDFRGERRVLHGRLAVGILIIQDLLVVIVLTALAGLGAPDGGDSPGVAGGLVRAFGGMALLGGIAFVSSRWLLPRPFSWIARSREAAFIWSLCWCFLFIIAAEQLKLSFEIGAFVAGVSLAQLPHTAELHRRVQPLVNFFIALFFVTLGLHMQLEAATPYVGIAIALSLLVLIGKPLVVMAVLVRQGLSERTSFMAAIAVGQISEFSFIVASLGVEARILDPSVLSLVGVLGIVTLGASSYMITHSDAVYARARRWGLLKIFGAAADEAEHVPFPGGHIVVVGMNSLGRRIVQALVERGEQVVAIDTDPAKLEGLPASTLVGDAEDDAVLAEANLARARLLVSALQIQEANVLLAYRCRQLGVPASIHAFDPAAIGDLEHIGVDHLIVSRRDGIRLVAAEFRRAGVLR